jgi:signal transduction histidine kinase
MREHARAERWISGLRRIGTDLAAGHPLPRLLTTALAALQDLFGADRGAIFLGPPIQPAASFGLSIEYVNAVLHAYRDGPGGTVERELRTVHVHDVREGTRMGALAEAARREGFRSMAIAPLVYAGKPRGGVALYHDRPTRYDDEDLQLLEIFAEQLALAAEIARRQRQLEDERSSTALMIEELPVAAVLVNEEGVFRIANREARRHFPGGSMAELIDGRRPLLDEHGDPLPPERMPVRRALAGETVLGETVLVPVGPTGMRSYLVYAIPLDSDALLVFQDITASRELDVRKDAFLQIVSHELRSPVTALRIYVDLLQRRPERSSTLLPRVDAQVERLRDLLGKLLDVAGLEAEALEMREVDVARLAADVAAEAGRLDPVRPVTLTGAESAMVHADPRRLREALLQLVANAQRHGAGEIEVEIERNDQRALVRVSDRGPGVPRERLPFLFERFSATRAALPAGGLGLGLYVAQAVARAHGGRLGYQERAAGGASFWLMLPVEPEEEHGGMEAPPPPSG